MKKILNLFFAVIIAVLSITGSAQAQFTPIHPTDIQAIWNASYVSNNTYCVGGVGGIMRTTNNGTSFTRVFGTNDSLMYINDVHFVNSTLGFAVGSDFRPNNFNMVLKTTNGGVNWLPVSLGLLYNHVPFQIINNHDTVSISGSWASVLQSTNLGVTWSVKSNDSTGWFYENWDLLIKDGRTFAVEDRLYRSTDNLHWKDLRLDTGANGGYNYSGLGVSGNRIFAVGNQTDSIGSATFTAISYTTDYGDSWNHKSFSERGGLLRIKFLPDGLVGYAMGGSYDGGGCYVYKTTNAGNSWNLFYSAPAPYYLLKDIIINSATDMSFMGYSGDQQFIIHYNAVTGFDPIEVNVADKILLGQNYPNPFNPTTQIDFTLAKPGLVSLKIYDVSGREVATLTNEVMTAGSHTVAFDGSKLNSGVYFYTLQTENYKDTKKMLLVK